MLAHHRFIEPRSKAGISSCHKLLAAITTFTLLYILFTSTQDLIMSSPEDHTNPAIPIEITISDVTNIEVESSPSPSVSLLVTLRNTNPDKPVSFLRWSSPFDAKAAAMGIYVFTSESNGQPARCQNLRFKRKVPDSGIYNPEDTIRIEVGESLKREVIIKTPEVTLEDGEKYSITASGFWMYVLVGDHSELKTGQEGVLRGDFQSKAVKFEVAAR